MRRARLLMVTVTLALVGSIVPLAPSQAAVEPYIDGVTLTSTQVTVSPTSAAGVPVLRFVLHLTDASQVPWDGFTVASETIGAFNWSFQCGVNATCTRSSSTVSVAVRMNPGTQPQIPSQMDVALQYPGRYYFYIDWNVNGATDGDVSYPAHAPGSTIPEAGRFGPITFNRATRVVNEAVSPVPAALGGSLRVTGVAQRATYCDPNRALPAACTVGGVTQMGYWAPIPSRVVSIMFVKAGTTTPVRASTVTTNTKGAFARYVKVSWTGTWYAALPAANLFGSSTGARKYVPVRGNATRIVKFSVNPKPVMTGHSVRLEGYLQQLSKSGYWSGYGARSVQVYFDPQGTAGPVRVGAVGTSATGYFRVYEHQRVSGTWYVVFMGNSTRAYSASAKVVVAVAA